MTNFIDSPELGGPAPEASGGPARPAPAKKTGLFPLLARGWLRWRAWRRSRPFWAGIWLIIAGAELLLIPLPIRHIGIILHIGFGGVSGILIGAILIVLGLLLWFSPGQRVFYSIVAVLLAVAALVASNLGGFLIGTLFGSIGGGLGFAWMPGRPQRGRRRRRRHGPDVPDAGLTVLGDAAADTEAADGDAAADTEHAGADTEARTNADTIADADAGSDKPSEPGSAVQSASPGSEVEHGTILRGLAVLPALPLLAGLVHLAPATLTAASASPSASASPAPSASASPAPSASASPAPSTSASPAPSATAGPNATVSASPSTSASTSSGTPGPTSPDASASPGSSASSSVSPSTNPAPAGSSSSSPSASPTPTGGPPQFAASTAQATLTASSASLSGLAYDGVVSVPTASGSVQMLEFSATSIDLSGAQLAVTEEGTTMTTTASSLSYDGDVVLYATQLSGEVSGTSITITPSTPLSTIQQWLGQAETTPLQMTDMTTQQPSSSADAVTADSLQIS